MTMADALDRVSKKYHFPMEKRGDVTTFRINAEHGKYDAYCMQMEEEQLFLLFIDMNIKIPADRMGEMALFLSEINRTLKNGCFIVCRDTGDVILRFSQYIYGSDTDGEEQAERIILTAGVLADGSYERILKRLL